MSMPVIAVAAVIMAAVIMVTVFDRGNLNGMCGMGFEETDAPSKTYACQKCCCEFRSIMGVKLNFRQDV